VFNGKAETKVGYGNQNESHNVFFSDMNGFDLSPVSVCNGVCTGGASAAFVGDMAQVMMTTSRLKRRHLEVLVEQMVRLF